MMRFIVFFVATILLPVWAFARMESENYRIDSDALDIGGGHTTSTSYMLDDAFGELATGIGTSANYREESRLAGYLFRVLSVSAPATAALSQRTISVAPQTTTGIIGNVEVVNDDTAPWSLTMATQHFTAMGQVKLLSGNNATVNFVGRYDGLDGVLSPNGTFLVEITTGGTVGTAVFKWTDPAGNETTGVTTTATVTLSNGVSVQFSPATYAAGDRWSINVDVLPYTGLTVTPGTITVISGESDAIAGITGVFTGSGATSDARTLMTGASNNSAGTYRQNEGLELGIHANSLDGNFEADAVLTVI